MTAASEHDAILLALYNDRRKAHRVIFGAKGRHANLTPPFHYRMIDDFHARDIPNVCEIGFRGCAKSTIGEEAVTLGASFRDFQNGLIVGASLDLACERLHSVRRHFERNEDLLELFGDQRARPWGDESIELRSGVRIKAMGRGQSLRGTKAEDMRPDFIWADDIEDDDTVRTLEACEKVQIWFLSELIPAGDAPNLRVRLTANDLHPDCLANKLKLPGSGFIVRVFPWIYLDERGEEKPTWPDRFPLEICYLKKRQMTALGRKSEYEREYMCSSERPEQKPFKPDMYRVEPRARTWEAVYAMLDPARGVRQGAATTGICAWSWIGPRLTIWEGKVAHLMPDQIISEVFRLSETYSPVKIGFEEDGLNEWALQPIRTEQVRRGLTVPLVPCKAPRSKLDFIRGLQPYFQAREVWFTQDNPDFWAQFLSFPSGLIDGPNALAYATDRQMKPGIPVYDDWTRDHVAERLIFLKQAPAWLALNATKAMVTAVLVQHHEGRLKVFADWVREGEPGAVLPDILREANLEAGQTCRLVAGPLHYDRYNNVGLLQAVARRALDTRCGAGPEVGRGELRGLLRAQARGFPALQIASGARWTLNGFAGGYCRALLKQNQLAETTEEGPYRVLMEGLESFAGLLALGIGEGSDKNYSLTATGRRYITSRPGAGAEDIEQKLPDLM